MVLQNSFSSFPGFLRILVCALSTFLLNIPAFSQIYSGSGGSIIQVVDTSRFNINVSGLSPANIDNNFGLISVAINITHTADRDIDCFLASPDGTMIELTTDNGSFLDNYTNTVFRYDAGTSITDGFPPFTGTFRPEGDISLVNNSGAKRSEH